MKRIALFLFVLFSIWGSAQQLPPPPAAPNLLQKQLIDEFIEVSHYKKSIINYAKNYLELKMFDYSVDPPKELLSKEQARSIINNFNFDHVKSSLYSSFSFIPEDKLKELVKFHRAIGGQLSKDDSAFLITPTLDLNIKNQLDYAIENIKK